jgi:serine/threonine protein kinase
VTAALGNDGKKDQHRRAGSEGRRELVRLSRSSSAKRTAKEIVDYLVPDEDKYKVNETIMKDRDKLIKFNKLYIKKHGQMPPTSLEFYEYTELIGKGAFGKVTLGIHKLTGRYVAIKAIDKAFLQDNYSKQKVMQEVYILKKIRHQNVIRLFEVFETPKHVLLVMEYAGGGDLL